MVRRRCRLRMVRRRRGECLLRLVLGSGTGTGTGNGWVPTGEMASFGIYRRNIATAETGELPRGRSAGACDESRFCIYASCLAIEHTIPCLNPKLDTRRQPRIIIYHYTEYCLAKVRKNLPRMSVDQNVETWMTWIKMISSVLPFMSQQLPDHSSLDFSVHFSSSRTYLRNRILTLSNRH